MLSSRPSVVLVVSSITVASEPEGSVMVTGTTTAAVVDAKSVAEELLVSGALDWLVDRPSASNELKATLLVTGMLELDRGIASVGPAPYGAAVLGNGPVAAAADVAFGKIPEVPGVSDGKPADGRPMELRLDSGVEEVFRAKLDELAVAVIAAAAAELLEYGAAEAVSGRTKLVLDSMMVVAPVTLIVVVRNAVLVDVVRLPVP